MLQVRHKMLGIWFHSTAKQTLKFEYATMSIYYLSDIIIQERVIAM